MLAQTYDHLSGVNSARICDAAACNDKNAIYELTILIFTRMKKSLFMIFAAMTALFMVSCEPEDTVEVPTVSFAVQPVNVDGVFTLTLMASGYNGTEPVTIPVNFSGTAVEGEDYFVSAEEFVIGGLEPVSTITVRAANSDAEGKTVTAALGTPDGFALGNLSSVTFTLVPVQLYASFESQVRKGVVSAGVNVQIFDRSGMFYRVGQAMTITLEVDESKSTAVLGTNFEFEGGKSEIVIEQNGLEGTLILNMIEPYDENHNKVVLNIVESDNIHIGTYGSVEVTFSGSPWEALDGEWVINELVTDREYFEGQYYDMCSKYDLLPQFNANDKITFDLETGTFTPAFESSFKDYFIGESSVKQGDYYDAYGTIDPAVLLVELDNVNRFFSPAETSEDKVAYIGARFITDSETGDELLDFYVLDYESHTFCPEWLDPMYGMYMPDKPTAGMVYLEMTFKRAE